MLDFMKQDIDRLLSYETKQQVRINDRWLGVSFVGFQLAIIAYIVGYVFIYDDGYLEYEYSRGTTTTYIDKTSDVAVASSGKMVGMGTWWLSKYVPTAVVQFPQPTILESVRHSHPLPSRVSRAREVNYTAYLVNLNRKLNLFRF